MNMQDNDSVVDAFSGVSWSLSLSLPKVLSKPFSDRASQACENHAKTYIWVPKHKFKSLTLIFYSGFPSYYSKTSLFLLEGIVEMHSYQHVLLKSL